MAATATNWKKIYAHNKSHNFIMSHAHVEEVTAFFNAIDLDKSGKLEINELRRLFGENTQAVANELDGMGNGEQPQFGVIWMEEIV